MKDLLQQRVILLVWYEMYILSHTTYKNYGPYSANLKGEVTGNGDWSRNIIIIGTIQRLVKFLTTTKIIEVTLTVQIS